MVDAHPFVGVFASPEDATQEALLGFILPHSLLPTHEMVDFALQHRLIDTLWDSGIAAITLRLIRTTSSSASRISILCRLRCPAFVATTQFRTYCLHTASRIQQLFRICKYTLQPLTSPAELTQALLPFQIQAVSELRRKEEVLIFQDAHTRYETYVTYPWEWVNNDGRLHIFEVFLHQSDEYLINIYLEPTMLDPSEEEILNHVTSPQVRLLLQQAGRDGQIVSDIYGTFARNLQKPYLLRITLAASKRETLERLNTALLDESYLLEMPPVLQWPQEDYEWHRAKRHLQNLEWMPWGNMREYTPGTARLRYLVNSKGACMGFDFPTVSGPFTSEAQRIKVLLVFANPLTQAYLRLGTEDRIIHEAVKLSRYRDNIDITVLHAATVHDLRRALLENDFQIVHIAGHGIHQGLLLEDLVGKEYLVPQEALAELLAAYSETLRCVILNACYSLEQGQLIALGVPFTIAIEGRLSDSAAREFARGFYDALGAGKEIDFAYEEGKRSAHLAASHSPFKARLLRKN